MAKNDTDLSSIAVKVSGLSQSITPLLMTTVLAALACDPGGGLAMNTKISQLHTLHTTYLAVNTRISGPG